MLHGGLANINPVISHAALLSMYAVDVQLDAVVVTGAKMAGILGPM